MEICLIVAKVGGFTFILYFLNNEGDEFKNNLRHHNHELFYC